MVNGNYVHSHRKVTRMIVKPSIDFEQSLFCLNLVEIVTIIDHNSLLNDRSDQICEISVTRLIVSVTRLIVSVTRCLDK